MSTVYVVSRTCYEDVEILGVYDAIEKAKTSVYMYEANRVEEFHINHFPLYKPIPDGMFLYRISLYGDFLGDDIVVCGIQEMNHDSVADKGIDLHYETKGIRSFHDIVAKDEDYAIALAKEKHKDWVDDPEALQRNSTLRELSEW